MNQYRTEFSRNNFFFIEDAFCCKLAKKWITNFYQINSIELDKSTTSPESEDFYRSDGN